MGRPNHHTTRIDANPPRNRTCDSHRIRLAQRLLNPSRALSSTSPLQSSIKLAFPEGKGARRYEMGGRFLRLSYRLGLTKRFAASASLGFAIAPLYEMKERECGRPPPHPSPYYLISAERSIDLNSILRISWWFRRSEASKQRGVLVIRTIHHIFILFDEVIEKLTSTTSYPSWDNSNLRLLFETDFSQRISTQNEPLKTHGFPGFVDWLTFHSFWKPSKGLGLAQASKGRSDGAPLLFASYVLARQREREAGEQPRLRRHFRPQTNISAFCAIALGLRVPYPFLLTLGGCWGLA